MTIAEQIYDNAKSFTHLLELISDEGCTKIINEENMAVDNFFIDDSVLEVNLVEQSWTVKYVDEG